jgi:hypothetical protein
VDAVTRGAGAPSWYNAVWRWHFYAGLFCLPFVLWLSVTGTIYLWKPQIEAWQERGYDALPVGPARGSPQHIVAAALTAVPGASLSKYQLPETPRQAVRVLIASRGVETRVYVDPYRLSVLGSVREDARLMKTIATLHGTLLAGAPGSWLVAARPAIRARRHSVSTLARRTPAVLARHARRCGHLGQHSRDLPDRNRLALGQCLGRLSGGGPHGDRRH